MVLFPSVFLVIVMHVHRIFSIHLHFQNNYYTDSEYEYVRYTFIHIMMVEIQNQSYYFIICNYIKLPICQYLRDNSVTSHHINVIYERKLLMGIKEEETLIWTWPWWLINWSDKTHEICSKHLFIYMHLFTVVLAY